MRAGGGVVVKWSTYVARGCYVASIVKYIKLDLWLAPLKSEVTQHLYVEQGMLPSLSRRDDTQLSPGSSHYSSLYLGVMRKYPLVS